MCHTRSTSVPPLTDRSCSWYPHGGLRPFHQKSTFLNAIKFMALRGANSVTCDPESGVHETLVVHRVVSLCSARSSPRYKFKPQSFCVRRQTLIVCCEICVRRCFVFRTNPNPQNPMNGRWRRESSLWTTYWSESTLSS